MNSSGVKYQQPGSNKIDNTACQLITDEIVFDNEPVETIVYGNLKFSPDPTNVIKMLKSSVELSEIHLRAVIAVLASHHEALILFCESVTEKQKQYFLKFVKELNHKDPIEDIDFLFLLNRYFSILCNDLNLFELASKIQKRIFLI